MKEITIIYPDGKPHNVSVFGCEIYELDGVQFTLVEYVDNGATCITMAQMINGQMYKVPFHNIDFSRAIKIGDLPLENIPSVMSTVIFRDELTDQEEIDSIQEIANETYARPEWLTATAVQYKEPRNYAMAQAKPTSKFEHTLYTTYYYDIMHRPVELNRNAVIYEHRYGLYENTPQSHSEFFEKPVLFGEVAAGITNYVYENGQNIAQNEELAPIIVRFEATPGTTVSDYIKTPDGKLRQVLLLVQPGIHEYTVHFGKCPYKELHRAASNPENTQVQIIDDGNRPGNIEDAFREGFNLERQIVIGKQSFGYGDYSYFDFGEEISQNDNSTGQYRR